MKPGLEANQMDQPRPGGDRDFTGVRAPEKSGVPGKITGRLSAWGAGLMPRNLILRLAAGTVKKLNQK
jgi:hypothetical protein